MGSLGMCHLAILSSGPSGYNNQHGRWLGGKQHEFSSTKATQGAWLERTQNPKVGPLRPWDSVWEA